MVGFGVCSVDFLGLVERYPEPGEKVSMQAFSRQGGGNTGTALVAAARLGAKTAFLGKLGYDEYSRFVLDEFGKEGVDTQFVTLAEGAQPHLSFIHVDNTGEKRIARYWRPFALHPEELNREVIQRSKILFLDHYFTATAVEAAKWTQASGGTIVVDAERTTKGLDAILALADYVVASRRFAREQLGELHPEKAAERLQQKWGNTVVITAGERGAYGKTVDETWYQPAFQIDAVDTTGAGDVFHGAFMVGVVKNWGLAEILEFSAAVAALKCRGLGGRAGIPHMGEAMKFLRENGTRSLWKKE